MERRLMARVAGVVLVLVGGYFLLGGLGFVLPQVTFNLPQINWNDATAAIAGGLALVRPNLLWPAAVLVLGLLLLARARRGVRSR